MVTPAASRRADDHAAGDHEHRVEDVVGRDDARAVAGRRTQLDQRVHRHAELRQEHNAEELHP
jgi:hypothetical protein